MLGSLYSEAMHFATDKEKNYSSSNANPLVAVSKEFQQSVSAMFPTSCAQQNRSVTLSDLEVFSLSKTFAVIKNISIYVKNIQEFRKLFDLRNPPFSDLLHLTLELDFPFDHGNEIADFVLRFQALNTMEIRSDWERSFLPEVFTFFNKLFKTPNIIPRFVMYVHAFLSFLTYHKFSDPSSPQAAEFRTLTNNHQIHSFLVQKMQECYRCDGGRSLIVFVEAMLVNSIMPLEEQGNVDPQELLNEMKLCLDFLEPFILNGNDLLHPSFVSNQYSVVSTPYAFPFTKFQFIASVADVFYYISKISRACCLEFMKQYGRRLIPALVNTVFSNFDGSQGAFYAARSTIYLLTTVVADQYWTDKVTVSSNIEDFKNMEQNGRRILEHIPFDKCAIVVQACVRATQEKGDNCSINCIGSSVSQFLKSVKEYCGDLFAIGGDDLDFVHKMTNSVAARINEHNILKGIFSCIKQTFEQCQKGPTPQALRQLKRWTSCLIEMICTDESEPNEIFFVRVNAITLFCCGDGGAMINEAADVLNLACDKMGENIHDVTDHDEDLLGNLTIPQMKQGLLKNVAEISMKIESFLNEEHSTRFLQENESARFAAAKISIARVLNKAKALQLLFDLKWTSSGQVRSYWERARYLADEFKKIDSFSHLSVVSTAIRIKLFSSS